MKTPSSAVILFFFSIFYVVIGQLPKRGFSIKPFYIVKNSSLKNATKIKIRVQKVAKLFQTNLFFLEISLIFQGKRNIVIDYFYFYFFAFSQNFSPQKTLAISFLFFFSFLFLHKSGELLLEKNAFFFQKRSHKKWKIHPKNLKNFKN